MRCSQDICAFQDRGCFPAELVGISSRGDASVCLWYFIPWRNKETSVKSSTGLHCVHEGHWALHFSVTTCYFLFAFLIFIFVRFSRLFSPAYAGVTQPRSRSAVSGPTFPRCPSPAAGPHLYTLPPGAVGPEQGPTGRHPPQGHPCPGLSSHPLSDGTELGRRWRMCPT